MSNLEKIYNLRFYIFSIRFFPLFLAVIIVFSYIIPLYGYLHICFVYGILAIFLSWIFSKIWVRFKAKLKHSQKLYNKGEVVEVYKIYNDLQSEVLWSRERFTLNLYRAKLFFDQGNHKRFLNLLDELSSQVEKYPKEKAFYALLRAFYFEINNNWSDAKKELEDIYESTTDNYYKLQACNNIARIEQVLGHQVSSKYYYEKAYEILKQKPNAKYFPIVIHNLLFAYARSNETQKAKKLLDEYWQLVDKKDPEQVIQYANDMTHYARETQDNELLQKSYKIVEDSVVHLLKNKENIALEVHELRMRYNDNLEFEKYFKITFEKIKMKKDDFLLIEKLNVLRELRHVLIQKIQTTTYPDNEEWIEYFRWSTQWNLSLQTEIENNLKNTESSLSDVRIFWLEQLVQLQKAKMAFPKIGESFNIENLQQMTNYIEEMISIWKEVENEIRETNEIFHLMDEVFAYVNQTNDQKIEAIYKEKFDNYLKIADELLEKYWQRPDISEYLIALSHFFLVFQNNKEMAKKWIDRFDSKKVSLRHYAKFVSIMYETVKNTYKNQKF
ncbi:MAG: hypothetical protein AB7E13_09935 [Arcobacteraceae bacterium]